MEEGHTTAATLIINCLTIQADTVSYQEAGVGHSRLVLVSKLRFQTNH